jgi:hypothetical protein
LVTNRVVYPRIVFVQSTAHTHLILGIWEGVCVREREREREREVEDPNFCESRIYKKR